MIILFLLLFFGCESNPIEPENYEEYNFLVDTRLELDNNGYYHLDMSENNSGSSEQSLVRFTAITNNPNADTRLRLSLSVSF